MLSEKLAPTPLIAQSARKPIVIMRTLPRCRWRLLFLCRRFSGLLLRVLWLKLTRRYDAQAVGVMLREFLQQLGILWIKVGQLLSMRVDLLSPGICDELSKLQDEAHGFSSDAIIRIIEAQLGAPIAETFSAFETTPFAAASISQVHRARLKREQAAVVIKVRKPGTKRTYDADIKIIRAVVRVLLWLRIKPYMRWRDMQWEIEQLMTEELDFRYEAANMVRMRKTLRAHKVYVPKVFARYSRQQVLVMEFVDGVLMSDYLKVLRSNPAQLDAWRITNQVQPGKVGRRLFSSMMRQLFEDNLFHGDLHPGNIMLLRNSRIACIDFGSIGFMDQDFLEKYGIYLQALTRQEYGKVFDVYLQFPDYVPSADLTHLRHEVIQILQSWHDRCQIENLPYTDKSIIALNDTFLRVLGQYRIAMTWVFLRFTRAVTTADAAFRELIPDLDVTELTQHYLRMRMRRNLKGMLHQQHDFGVEQQALLQLPEKISDGMVFFNTIMRRSAQVFSNVTTAIIWFGTMLNLSLLLLRVFAGCLVLNLLDVLHWLPPLDVQVWGLIAVTLLSVDRILAGLKKRCQQLEPRGAGYH